MATEIEEIFEDFLSPTDDYAFILHDDEDEIVILQQLFYFYKYARAKFTACPKDLGTNYPSFHKLPAGVPMEIKGDLDYVEKDIIVSLMKVAYIETKINTGKVLQQAMTDKDFALTSQANHLRQLTELFKTYKSRADKDITKYTYRELGRT